MKKQVAREHKTSVEVDISGRVEDSATDTIFGFSNGLQYKISLPKKVKRECISTFRKLGKTGKTFYFELYCAGLTILLKEHIKKISLITLDEEYRQRNKDIKQIFLNLFRKTGKSLTSDQIRFELIGKESNAHIIAINCHRRRAKPNKILKSDEIFSLILTDEQLRRTKKDRGLLKSR